MNWKYFFSVYCCAAVIGYNYLNFSNVGSPETNGVTLHEVTRILCLIESNHTSNNLLSECKSKMPSEKHVKFKVFTGYYFEHPFQYFEVVFPGIDIREARVIRDKSDEKLENSNVVNDFWNGVVNIKLNSINVEVEFLVEIIGLTKTIYILKR